MTSATAHRTVAAVLLLLACAATVTLADTHAATSVRGVKQRDQHRYTSAEFRCFDGSATVSRDRINDDYCDCNDGSDEPGTSACVNSKFWCPNKGAKGKSLPSSRVRDGVCDCCDGSDEWLPSGGSACANTCEEHGRAAREAALEEIRSTEAGLAARNALLASAQETLSTRRAKLVKYEALMATRRAKLDAARAVKEAEEAVEQAERDKRNAAAEAAKQAAEAAAAAAAPAATEGAAQTTEQPAAAGQTTEPAPVGTPAADVHKAVDPAEFAAGLGDVASGAAATAAAGGAPVGGAPAAAPAQENFPYPPEYAPQPTGGDAAKPAAAAEESKENFPYPAEYAYQAADDAAKAAEAAEAEAHADSGFVEPEYADGEEGDDQDDDDDEEDEIHPYFQTEAPYVHPSAEAARANHTSIETKVSRLQKKLDDLKKLLERDYGREGEFAHWDGKCYDLQVKQYTYEVCPYKDAKQKEGHASTSLGSWAGMEELPTTGQRVMKFTGGQSCWQGPQRSLTVKLACGGEDRLTAVEEPSKCVYEIQMQTPAVCNQQHVQALRLNVEGGGALDEEEEEEQH